MSRTRLVAGLVALAVLLVPLAGCGGDDRGPSAKATTPAPSQTSANEDAGDFVSRVTTAMATKRTAHLEIELGSSMSATADVAYAEKSTSLVLKMITGTQTVRLVLAGGVMYLQQTKGGKYLKIGKDDPALGSLYEQVSSIGPKSVLERVEPGIEKVENLGTETVDGEKLGRYRLTVDTTKVSTLFGVQDGSGKAPKTVTYDVLVDGDFLLRQVRATTSGQKLVIKASDWGKPVTIAAPPASQVVTR